MKRPPATAGLHHVALRAKDPKTTATFYMELLGMRLEWQPDEHNYYLTSGSDNLAIHQGDIPQTAQRLDHIGFIIDHIEDVDNWHKFLVYKDVEIAQAPCTHRDGARSFYFKDPEGTVVQMIYHPPLSRGKH
jgi:catechol 2,3-dioxygenase-like lactoylglutathione lyase family enzyme